MPRTGAQGGGGGGGGGGGSSARGQGWARAGTARIAGVEFEVEPGTDQELSEPAPEPGELFPDRKLKVSRPLSKDEKAQVATYCALRDAIRAGPLWTVLDSETHDHSKHGVSRKPSNTITDPFEHGVETYSQKYTQQKRKASTLHEREWVLNHFPRELWGVLDPRYATSTGTVRKKAKIDPRKTKARLDALLDEAEKHGDDDAAVHSDDEPAEEEIVDDEFEEDEDDMAGDYNAEQYFDDGGDDAGDDYDGGDGGGDDGMY